MTPDPEDSTTEDMEEDEEWEPAPWIPYPYKDFETHFRDHVNRRFENADGDEGAFVRNVLKLKRYFDEFYEEPYSMRNHGTFVIALSHVAKHAADYDTGLLAISHDDGLMVSEGLIRALHWYFAERPRSEWGTDAEAFAQIKQWAEHWIAENK